MHKAWESESLSFRIVIIKLSHSNKIWSAGALQFLLEWPNPSGSQIAAQSENKLVMIDYFFFTFLKSLRLWSSKNIV